MPALPTTSQYSAPTAFHIATSDQPRSSTTEDSLYSSFQSSAASRALSTASPSSLTLKLHWIEQLLAPGVPLETLKEATQYLDSTSWDDLIDERHMEGLCPYPTCSNPASTPYTANKQDEEGGNERKFRLEGGGLFDSGSKKGGKEKGAYCSVRCRARSEWIKGSLGKEGVKGGELLEDVEKRREAVRDSTKEILNEKRDQEGTNDGKKETSKEAFKSDLMSTLTIHEKPTPTSSSPLPPSLSSDPIDFERPSQSSTPSSSRFSLTPSSSSKPLKNSSSALLPFTTTSLGRTILSTSRRAPIPSERQPQFGINGLPPVKFLGEPRMIDERGREVEWEGEEYGEDEEAVRGLFEEEMRVREMMEKGEL
ncbi:hypothetical protein JCM5353_008528 [Sporobolomyces roseus]